MKFLKNVNYNNIDKSIEFLQTINLTIIYQKKKNNLSW